MTDSDRGGWRRFGRTENRQKTTARRYGDSVYRTQIRLPRLQITKSNRGVSFVLGLVEQTPIYREFRLPWKRQHLYFGIFKFFRSCGFALEFRRLSNRPGSRIIVLRVLDFGNSTRVAEIGLPVQAFPYLNLSISIKI